MNYVKFREIEPVFGGFGSEADLLRDADRLLTPLPGPIVAALDRAPMPRKQRALVKNRPTMFFVALAETARWLLVKFIERVQLRARSSTYRVGGVLVKIAPRNERDPARLAAQFLTVANRNPVAAMQVAGQMAGEIATALAAAAAAGAQKAYVEPALVAGRAGSRAAAKAQKDASRAASQAAVAAKKAAEDAARAAGKAAADVKRAGAKAAKDAVDATMSVFGLRGLGCPACALGDYGIGEAAAGVGGVFGVKSVADLLGLVTAAIAMAEVVVPMLLSAAKGVAPLPPSPNNLARAEADAAAIDQVAESAGVDLRPAVFGVPRTTAFFAAAAIALVGGGVYALTRKRRRR